MPNSSDPMTLGTVTTCTTPPLCGHSDTTSCPSVARWIASAVAGSAGAIRSRPACASTRPAGSVTTNRSEPMRTWYSLRDGLNGRRVARSERRLEIREIGDQSGFLRDVTKQRRPVLFELSTRLLEAAAQLFLRLRRDRDVDAVDGDGNRQHREGGAGEEDPVRERRENGHRFSRTKCCSTSPRRLGDDHPARVERHRFVPRHDGVGARRHVVDPVTAIVVGHREVRMAKTRMNALMCEWMSQNTRTMPGRSNRIDLDLPGGVASEIEACCVFDSEKTLW